MSVKVPLQNINALGQCIPFSFTKFISHVNPLSISSLLHLMTDIRIFGRFGELLMSTGLQRDKCVTMALCVISSEDPVNETKGVPRKQCTCTVFEEYCIYKVRVYIHLESL